MTVITARLIDWIDQRLENNTQCYVSVPAQRPKRFVTIERTGGNLDRFFDYPTFAIQAWAGSTLEAETLATGLRNVMCRDLELEPWIGAVTLGTLYNWPDPDSRQARYQFTLELQTLNT